MEGFFLLSKMSLNVITVKMFCISKSQYLKNLYSGTHRGGFKFFLILDLWCISSHSEVVFDLSKNLLSKSGLGHCVLVLTLLRSLIVTTALFF